MAFIQVPQCVAETPRLCIDARCSVCLHLLVEEVLPQLMKVDIAGCTGKPETQLVASSVSSTPNIRGNFSDLMELGRQ